MICADLGTNLFLIFFLSVWFSNADSKGSPWDWQSGNAKFPILQGYDDSSAQRSPDWNNPVGSVSGPQTMPLHTNVTVVAGGTAQLPCRIKNLQEYTVSWLRGRDTTVLSVGHHTFSSDTRFQVVTSSSSKSDQDGLIDWNLQIKDVGLKDTGWYDCQVNTSPKISNKCYLHVTEVDPLALHGASSAKATDKLHVSPVPQTQIIPEIQKFLSRTVGARAEISGPSVIHLPLGGSLNLECTVFTMDAAPVSIEWKMGDRLLTPSSRSGVSMEAEKLPGTSYSRLILVDLKPHDQGTYTCFSEAAKSSASVDLLIANSNNDSASPRALAQMLPADEDFDECHIRSCHRQMQKLLAKIQSVEAKCLQEIHLFKQILGQTQTDSDGAEALASKVTMAFSTLDSALLAWASLLSILVVHDLHL